MRFKFSDKFESFYFIGIGGVSMSGLAKYLISLGKNVGGSDVAENEYTSELRNLGAKISFGSDAEDIEDYGKRRKTGPSKKAFQNSNSARSVFV